MNIASYITRKYQHIRRYNQILAVLARYGFANMVSFLEEKKRLGFLRKLVPRKTYHETRHLSRWERIRRICEDLGPTFIKFGQLLSNRHDLLPAELIRELEKLQDAVPPMSGSIAVAIMERELRKKKEELFSEFDENAFASASIAQVHRGKLKSGERVVVKIQRPHIRQMIVSDIRVMYRFAAILANRIPYLKSLDPAGLVRNFEESILKELDFIHESINLQRFAYNFNGDSTHDGLTTAPRVYRELTTRKILTLEYIDGIKISDVRRLTGNGYRPDIIARRLLSSYMKQIFRYGFFHADPHPGNIFVLPGNKICFVDFGMMGNILRRDLEQLGYLFLSVRSKDVQKIMRALQVLSNKTVISNSREMESDLTEFVASYAVKNLHKNELSTVLFELKDIIVKHHLKVPSHFFLLARSLMAAEGVARQLDPSLNFMHLARPYMVRIVAKRYNPFKFTKRVINSIYEMGMYMEDFPADIKNVLRRLNTGEVKTELHPGSLEPILDSISRSGRQTAISVILGALIIGSSLILIANLPPRWGGIPVMGIIGLLLSAWLTGRLMKSFGGKRE